MTTHANASAALRRYLKKWLGELGFSARDQVWYQRATHLDELVEVVEILPKRFTDGYSGTSVRGGLAWWPTSLRNPIHILENQVPSHPETWRFTGDNVAPEAVDSVKALAQSSVQEGLLAPLAALPNGATILRHVQRAASIGELHPSPNEYYRQGVAAAVAVAFGLPDAAELVAAVQATRPANDELAQTLVEQLG